LAEEVAILARAAADLRGGRAQDALSALNEHQRKFPKGVLTQERRAARAQALCAVGRFSEARAELARLPKASPQAIRAATFCDKRSAE
jgi:predicted Zn-dependent protease